ncbi:hypothetical protein TWF281_005466 [Arthrobotrys megalospora]
MKLKYWIPGLLILAESAISQSNHTSTISASPSNATNIVGDYNRALDGEPDATKPRNPYESAADPNKGNHRKFDFWKRGKLTPRRDDDPDPPKDFDPTLSEYRRWLAPPEGPRQIYGCINKRVLAEGLLPMEIKKTGRYMMWQLEDSSLIFKSQSTDPQNPCFPVFCYEEFNAVVGICNKRPDITNTVTIYGYEIGRMVWEMGVSVDLDAKYLRKPWEGGHRTCQNPESDENAKLLSGSYIAWTSWSEDQWEITISKEQDGCGSWRGLPNWVTVGKGLIPDSYPLDIF